MTKQKQLDDIKQKILDDKVTPDLAKGATQLVFGVGSPDAEIVFIGEAPGKNEDLKGEPFVGAAGKFLDEMLEMIGMKRAAVYITNIVKYRPPDNRDPLLDEKEEFMPYLESELDVIKPKLIVTLGRHSLNCFLPESVRISECHGQPKRYKAEFICRCSILRPHCIAPGSTGRASRCMAACSRADPTSIAPCMSTPRPAWRSPASSTGCGWCRSRPSGSTSASAITPTRASPRISASANASEGSRPEPRLDPAQSRAAHGRQERTRGLHADEVPDVGSHHPAQDGGHRRRDDRDSCGDLRKGRSAIPDARQRAAAPPTGPPICGCWTRSIAATAIDRGRAADRGRRKFRLPSSF